MSIVDLTATVTTDPDGTLVVELRGEVDFLSAPLVEDCISTALRAGETRIAVDLAAVTFIDSAGLRALVTASEAAADAGRMLGVRAPTTRTLHLLELTGLDQVLHVEPT